MATNNSENKIKRTHLTPCRRVGLKRKSLGNSPLSSIPKHSPITSSSISHTSSVSTVNDDTSTPLRSHENRNEVVQQSEKKFKRSNLTAKTLMIDVLDENIQNIQSPKKYDPEEVDIIKKRIADKRIRIASMESTSRNLKQHNLEDLNSLILKWRAGCQTALKELLIEYQNQDQNLTMTSLLNSLGIPTELVHYSEAEMDFLS